MAGLTGDKIKIKPENSFPNIMNKNKSGYNLNKNLGLKNASSNPKLGLDNLPQNPFLKNQLNNFDFKDEDDDEVKGDDHLKQLRDATNFTRNKDKELTHKLTYENGLQIKSLNKLGFHENKSQIIHPRTKSLNQEAYLKPISSFIFFTI